MASQASLHILGMRTWWEGAVKTQKPSSIWPGGKKSKVVFIVAGRVVITHGTELSSASTDRNNVFLHAMEANVGFDIEPSLIITTTPLTVSIENINQSSDKTKANKIIFHFESKGNATEFLSTIRNEVGRHYIASGLFDRTFEKELNAKILEDIANGKDKPLRELYFACQNSEGPGQLVEFLWSVFRSLYDSANNGTSPTKDHASFALFLSAIAADPITLIIFLCWRHGRNLLRDFQATFEKHVTTGTDVTVDRALVFSDLLKHIQREVATPAWSKQRAFLLKVYEYPIDASISSHAVTKWALQFQQAVLEKLTVDFAALNQMLEEPIFLCYNCIKHFAEYNMTHFSSAFLTLDKDYLFSAFDAIVDDVKVTKAHFVEFLFHRNLQDKDIFKTLLFAFAGGSGHDDRFFELFLAEAFRRRALLIAVNVIKSLLFTDNGAPSQKSLAQCQKIPSLIYCALSTHALQRNTLIVDEHKALFEIALRFEYIVFYFPQLMFLETMGERLLRNDETVITRASVLAVMRQLRFGAYVGELTNFFLSNSPNPNAWQRREEINIISLLYGYMTLLIECHPITMVDAVTGKTVSLQNRELNDFFAGLPPVFYQVFLDPKTLLRKKLVAVLIRKFNVLAVYQNILHSPDMFSSQQHFNYEVLGALSFSPAQLSAELGVSLVQTAMKLKEYSDLHSKLQRIDEQLGGSNVSRDLLDRVTYAVIHRTDIVVGGDNSVTLDDLVACVKCATAVLNPIQHTDPRMDVMQEQINEALHRRPIAEWRGLFEAL